MPSVFLSYARHDLPLVEQLEARLKDAPSLSVWRDQDKIYGGQRWPKVLGEAIADQDIFLLAWSQAAAESHFVEFEWCTAIALKKTIVPCLLDDTPLAPSLRALHAHQPTDIEGLVSSLWAAGPGDTNRRTPVINALGGIIATEPQTVLSQAKSVFAEQHWTVLGNVYQAAGDIHIHTPHAPQQAQGRDQPLTDKWQTWVAVIVGVLAVVTYIVDFPQKIREAWTTPPVHRPQTIDQDKPYRQAVAGAIRNEENEPLPGVEVSLPRFNLSTQTDRLGQFQLEVTAPEHETVALLAQKPDYHIYETDVTLGNTALGFTMRRKR